MSRKQIKNSSSQLCLYEQRESGLLTLCIDFNVDSSTPSTILVTSDLTTKTYNNVPEVTLLISKYHLLSVIYYNYIGTSYPLASLFTLSSTVTVVLSSSPSNSMAITGVCLHCPI